MSEVKTQTRTKKFYVVTNQLDGEQSLVAALTSKTPERVAHENLSKAIKAKHAKAMKDELEALRDKIKVVRVTADHMTLMGLKEEDAIDLTGATVPEDAQEELKLEGDASKPEEAAAAPEEDFEV